MAASDNYVNELRNLHNKKTFGTSSKIPSVVSKLIADESLLSVLDYGAGKGNTSNTLREMFPDLTVYSYDPATFPNPLPNAVDLIYSSDVLEHIEPEHLDETLKDLSSRATKFQYHLIACHPAKKSLSDGRNAHLIIEQPAWWKNKLEQIEGWKIIQEEVTNYVATVKKGPPLAVTKYIVLMAKT